MGTGVIESFIIWWYMHAEGIWVVNHLVILVCPTVHGCPSNFMVSIILRVNQKSWLWTLYHGELRTRLALFDALGELAKVIGLARTDSQFFGLKSVILLLLLVVLFIDIIITGQCLFHLMWCRFRYLLTFQILLATITCRHTVYIPFLKS